VHDDICSVVVTTQQSKGIDVHAIRFLTRWLQEHSPIRHQTRLLSLTKGVQALASGGKLALTHLGRCRPGRAHVKHQIKAIDRLLGNRHLQSERDGIYRAIAADVLRGNKRPTLLIDWSDFEIGRHWVMLKAAVPLAGRAVTIYEMVFPFTRYNSPSAHVEFLEALSKILPSSCCPILVTDAGFRGPWFRAVEKLGWHWVGRIRNGIKYFNEKTGTWTLTDTLYRSATPKVRYVGQVHLSRRKQYIARLYLVRAYKTKQGSPSNRMYRKQTNSTLYRYLHKAPWLLATSLPHDRLACRKIKRLYALRMQIEETFRDLKNHRWGLGVRYAHSRDGKRLEILLLIAALTTLMHWLLGIAANTRGLASRFQANTERRRRVLSLVFLGQQVFLRPDEHINESVLKQCFLSLSYLIREAAVA
jgi:hypothetical protein